MGDLLDELLKQHVTPVLRNAGFTRSGAAYRLLAPNGDCAVVNFRRWTTSREVTGFFVFLSIAPLPWVEWLNRDYPQRMSRPRGQEHALLQWTLEAPARWQLGRLAPSAQDTLWGIADDADVAGCGQDLAKLLENGVAWLVTLVDRELLCATIQERYGEFHILPDRHVAQAILRSGDGQSEQVEHLRASPELKAWLAARS